MCYIVVDTFHNQFHFVLFLLDNLNNIGFHIGKSFQCMLYSFYLICHKFRMVIYNQCIDVHSRLFFLDTPERICHQVNSNHQCMMNIGQGNCNKLHKMVNKVHINVHLSPFHSDMSANICHHIMQSCQHMWDIYQQMNNYYKVLDIFHMYGLQMMHNNHQDILKHICFRKNNRSCMMCIWMDFLCMFCMDCHIFDTNINS